MVAFRYAGSDEAEAQLRLRASARHRPHRIGRGDFGRRFSSSSETSGPGTGPRPSKKECQNTQRVPVYPSLCWDSVETL